jgi:hypothetical protein
MRTLLTSTSCFPHAFYIAECFRSDKILIEAYETYAKQSFRNHFEIAGPNGRQKLTVPVIKTNGNQTLTKEIRISYELPWQKIHFRSLTTAYNRSPYLQYYIDHFLPFFEKRYGFLLDLNLEILRTILMILKQDKEIGLTQNYEKNPVDVADRRQELVAKRPVLPEKLMEYTQPFSERYGFLENLSVADVIFCLGPGAGEYLRQFHFSD